MRPLKKSKILRISVVTVIEPPADTIFISLRRTERFLPLFNHLPCNRNLYKYAIVIHPPRDFTLLAMVKGIEPLFEPAMPPVLPLDDTIERLLFHKVLPTAQP